MDHGTSQCLLKVKRTLIINSWTLPCTNTPKVTATGFATLDIDAIWRGTGPLYYCTSCRLGSCRGRLQSPRGQLMVRSFCSTQLESWVSISKPMCYAILFLSFQGHHMPGVPRTLARSSVSLQRNNSFKKLQLRFLYQANTMAVDAELVESK